MLKKYLEAFLLCHWLFLPCVLAAICDFEGGFCDWRQSTDDSFNWTLRRGQTPLSYTGPNGNHTNGTGHYAYIRAALHNEGDKARLIYGPFTGDLCIGLYYNMNGPTMGALNVYIDDRLLYSVHGDHLDRWIRADGFIVGQNSFLILEGVVGPGMFSDLAIDDITLTTNCSISCSSLEVFNDGSVTCTKGNLIGSTCTFTCSSGQMPISGSSVRTCHNFSEWTGKQPSCNVVPPAPCNFDVNNFCGWKQELYDEFNWTLRSGRTPSRNTGPNSDHTTGTGSYIYIEASKPAAWFDRARLTFRPVHGVFCFSFYYHMYGSYMGWLNIYFDGEKIFDVDGNYGDEWRKLEAQLNGTDSEIVIEGVVGQTFRSDLAIDDISSSVNCNVSCPASLPPKNGSMVCTSGNSVGSRCTFSCMSGGLIAGTLDRKCDPFGSWTGVYPVCAIDIRLVNGSSPFEGRVQVHAWGEWLGVCDSDWDINDARVVCRMLNFPEPSAAPTRWAFGPGTVYGWLNSLSCNGSESSLTTCQDTDLRKRGCYNRQNAGVVCGPLWCPSRCNCVFRYSSNLNIDYIVDCAYRRFTSIPTERIPYYTRILLMNGNELKRLQSGTFANFSWIHTLELKDNQIDYVEDGAFLSNTDRLDELFLDDNDITSLRREMFRGLEEMMGTFSIQRNKLRIITNGTFVDLKGHSLAIYLDDNFISVVEEGAFSNNVISALSLKGNQLRHIDSKTFKGIVVVNFLYLNLNNIAFIANDSFQSFSSKLSLVALGGNNNLTLPTGIFDGLERLSYVDLSLNNLTTIDSDLLKDAWLGAVSFSHNSITDFGRIFEDHRDLSNVFVNGNKIHILRNSTFRGSQKLSFLDMSENPVKIIEEGTFADTPELKIILLVGTSVQLLGLSQDLLPPILEFGINPTEHPLQLYIWDFYARVFLGSMGYHCKNTDKNCVPCTYGTFKRGSICQACPAGGFYQESMASYIILSHGFGCKRCPPGTFVSPSKAPGRAAWDCSSCPEGTDMTGIAEFRACYCLPGYYRLHRFGPCFKCNRGYLCSNETIVLASGFYWRWIDTSELKSFVNFTANVKTRNNSYSRNHSTLRVPLPSAYPCPVQSACHGGLESHCSMGYEGPLCAVCSRGYYKLLQTCQKCPTYPWLVARAVGIILVITLIAVVIQYGKKEKNLQNRAIADVVLARLKITIGFYQVTSGTLSAFSYVKWPTTFLKLVQYTEVLQLNLFQVVPVHCFSNNVRTDPYSNLILFISFDAAVIGGAVAFYLLSKVYLQRNQNEVNDRVLSGRKEQCIRVAFLVLFVTYPSTCVKIFQVLPSACHEICSSPGLACNSYLQADYSAECFTQKYNSYRIFAYLSVIFPVAFPAVVLYLVWKYHYKKIKNCERDTDMDTGNAVGSGIRFVYENYSDRCWYWEVIELVRKVILTSVLAYVGAQGRTYLGTAAIISGVYAVMFAYYQPVSDSFENKLMLLSLTVTNVNQNIGLLLKVPQEAISESVDKQADELGMTILLILANTLIVITLLVRYGATMVRAISELRRKPRCSVHCCLYVLQLTNGDLDGSKEQSAEQTTRHTHENELEARA